MKVRVSVSMFALLAMLFSCKSKKVATTTKRKAPIAKRTLTIERKTKISEVSPKKTSEIKRVSKSKIEEKKSAPKYGSYNVRIENYINQYAEIAMEQMQQYKIPASITLAQGILESGAGTGELTLKANNHFGIKCHDWKGQKAYHDDDTKQECFRKYSNSNFSFQDHSLFLTTRSRYFSLFQLEDDDYKGWAKGLRAAGYATDPKYPSKLIHLIDKFKLYRYDAKVLGKPEKYAKKSRAKSTKYTVKKGDTLYSIARKNKIPVDELKSLNGLEGNAIFEGQVLFVIPLPKEEF